MKTEYIILCKNRGDYLTQLKFEPTGDFEIHGGPAENAIRYTLEQATSLVEEMGKGYAIEPAPEPFQLTSTFSSCGPLYRGQFKSYRIEAAADLNSFQVINDTSDCDTFERDGNDFLEKSSAGVTDDWTEADFQTVLDEINRLDQQKTTYTLSEIEQYADSYTDDDGEEVFNYNLPGGWQVGCVIPGTMTPGSAWTAVKNTATETLERCIQIK